MKKSTERVLLAAFLAVTALLAGWRKPAPREVVTHRICYIDIDGNKVCE